MYLIYQNENENYPTELIGKDKNWLYQWRNKEEYKSFGELKKVNFFAGANNSGKSRFLRGLIKVEPVNDQISSSGKSLSESIKLFFEYKSLNYNKLKVTYRSDINSKMRGVNLINQNYYHLINNYHSFKDFFDYFRVERNNIIKNEIRTPLDYDTRNLLNFYNELLKIDDEIKYINYNKPNTKKYIPILRSIHSNEHLQKGNLIKTIKKNYGLEQNVYTGLNLYEQVLKLKNSNGFDRRKVKEFEKFLSKHFFDNKEIEITANTKSGEILFSVDSIEHPIYDLGDGIQSLIIILFPIYTANNNDWFFIEEPEINLHPGLQRVFVEALLNDSYLNSKNLKFFFTTHSNHFMDITISNEDMSIFQFTNKGNDKFSIKTNVKPSNEILNVLGVNTSSVFLANTSIWIEGPTDRKYISKILKEYNISIGKQFFKEDIDFSFFEYGGNLIEHYLFEDVVEFDEGLVREKINSFALSNKIFLLADNDNVDMRSSKGKRRKRLEENSKSNNNFLYQNTKYREIENLLPKQIISDFIPHLIDKTIDLNLLKTIEFSRNDYCKIGLGEFYKNLFIQNNIPIKSHKSFKADSGTLKSDYKLKLAEFVSNSNYNYKDFIDQNDVLKRIIVNLIKFIKQ